MSNLRSAVPYPSYEKEVVGLGIIERDHTVEAFGGFPDESLPPQTPVMVIQTDGMRVVVKSS